MLMNVGFLRGNDNALVYKNYMHPSSHKIFFSSTCQMVCGAVNSNNLRNYAVSLRLTVVIKMVYFKTTTKDSSK